MRPILFSLFGAEVYAYGAMLGLLFLVTMWLAERWTRADPDYPKDWSWSTGLVGAGFGVLGARLEFVRVNPERFTDDWSRVLSLDDGGLVFHGGLILGVLVCVGYALVKGIPIRKGADVTAVSMAVGLSMARVGCFLAGCCYGRPTDLPWGVVFTDPGSRAPLGIALHPTQVYAIVYNALLALLLHWRRRKPRFDGEVALLFLVAYPVLRAINESFRDDAQRGWFLETWLGPLLTNAQGVFLIVALAAGVVWGLAALRQRASAQG